MTNIVIGVWTDLPKQIVDGQENRLGETLVELIFHLALEDIQLFGRESRLAQDLAQEAQHGGEIPARAFNGKRNLSGSAAAHQHRLETAARSRSETRFQLIQLILQLLTCVLLGAAQHQVRQQGAGRVVSFERLRIAEMQRQPGVDDLAARLLGQK